MMKDQTNENSLFQIHNQTLCITEEEYQSKTNCVAKIFFPSAAFLSLSEH